MLSHSSRKRRAASQVPTAVSLERACLGDSAGLIVWRKREKGIGGPWTTGNAVDLRRCGGFPGKDVDDGQHDGIILVW